MKPLGNFLQNSIIPVFVTIGMIVSTLLFFDARYVSASEYEIKVAGFQQAIIDVHETILEDKIDRYEESISVLESKDTLTQEERKKLSKLKSKKERDAKKLELLES